MGAEGAGEEERVVEDAVAEVGDEGVEGGDAGADDGDVGFEGGPDAEVDGAPCGCEERRVSGLRSGGGRGGFWSCHDGV